MAARLRFLAGLAVIAGVAMLTSSVPVAQSQGGQTDDFTLRSFDRADRTIGIDESGDGDADDPGDRDIGFGPLFQAGEKAGAQQHDCVILKARKKFALRCAGTFRVRGRGSVEVAGVLKFSRRDPKSTLAVTGGTGEFRDAGGTMTFEGKRRGAVFRFHVVHH